MCCRAQAVVTERVARVPKHHRCFLCAATTLLRTKGKEVGRPNDRPAGRPTDGQQAGSRRRDTNLHRLADLEVGGLGHLRVLREVEVLLGDHDTLLPRGNPPHSDAARVCTRSQRHVGVVGGRGVERRKQRASGPAGPGATFPAVGPRPPRARALVRFNQARRKGGQPHLEEVAVDGLAGLLGNEHGERVLRHHTGTAEMRHSATSRRGAAKLPLRMGRLIQCSRKRQPCADGSGPATARPRGARDWRLIRRAVLPTSPRRRGSRALPQRSGDAGGCRTLRGK